MVSRWTVPHYSQLLWELIMRSNNITKVETKGHIYSEWTYTKVDYSMNS